MAKLLTMFKLCWFFLGILFTGCVEWQEPGSQMEGTYIGYYHRNHKDTTQVTLVFEGNYFAAAPYDEMAFPETSGMFHTNQASLVFQQKSRASMVDLNGPYQYEFCPDGSLRCWQEKGTDIKELILKQQ